LVQFGFYSNQQANQQLLSSNRSCFYDYSIFNEDNQSYNPRWLLNQTNLNYTEYSQNIQSAFINTNSSILKDNIYFGQYTNYLRGGYVYKLNSDLVTIQNELFILQQLSWLDQKTRALFIEFTLYNPNVNLFTFCSFIFEILPSGNILPSVQFISMNLWSSAREVTITICFAVYLVIILVLMTQELVEIKALGHKYVTQFWPLINWTLFACSWAALPIYVYKLNALHDIQNQMNKNSIQSFVNMSTLSIQNEILGILLAICSFIATIKLTRLLRFEEHLEYIVEAFGKCFRDLISYTILLLIIWLAFVQLMYLIYNKVVYEFRSFIQAMENSFIILLGASFNDTLKLLEINYSISAIIFSAYIIIIMWIVYNMMITLISENFDKIRIAAKLRNKNSKSLFQHFISKFKKSEDNIKLKKYVKHYDTTDIFQIRMFELIDRLRSTYQVDSVTVYNLNEMNEELKRELNRFNQAQYHKKKTEAQVKKITKYLYNNFK